MEVQDFEFTIEDLLNLHKHWITQQYVEERRTDVEIVLLLDERGLIVTLAQIQKIIRDWALDSLLASNNTSAASLDPAEAAESIELLSSTRASPSKTKRSYSPDDPDVTAMYANLPLPSIPVNKTQPQLGSNPAKQRSSPSTKDRLSLSCHHGPSPSEVHQVQATLESLPRGPSPLEIYADDEQAHEMTAVGLFRIPFRRHRRAGDEPAGSDATRARMRKTSKFRKRRKRNDADGDDRNL